MRFHARVVLAILLLIAVSAAVAWSIPSFSRKYQTSCSTCHYAFPQLNGFGKAFRNQGFRYPGGDENFRKEEPVSLGSEAYKQVWPDAIWPSDMPGTAPFSVHAVGRFVAAFSQPDTVANTTFEFPQEAELLYGGTLGEDFSFFGEVELELEDGEVEIALPFRLQWNQAPAVNVSLGILSPDPTPSHLRLTPTDYNVPRLMSGTAGCSTTSSRAWRSGGRATGRGARAAGDTPPAW